MSPEVLSLPRRTRRLGLYLPVTLLLLLALAWSAGWVFLRGRITSGLDEWISREAAAGRRWNCADRSVAGYPFRLEIRCSDFTLERPDVTASVGSLLVVSQVYNPRHVIAEASGPMRLKAGGTEVDGRWKQLRSSMMLTEKGFEQIDIVSVEPFVSVHEAGSIPFDLASNRFEGHVRPRSGDPNAVDLWAKSTGALIPGLGNLIGGGKERADLTADVSVTQTNDLPARPLWSELERWRMAGGILFLKSFKLESDSRRIEAAGQVSIDQEHRPEGQLELAAAGLGGILGQLTQGTGGLLGALLGGGQQAPRAGADPSLNRLPPLQIRNGRLLIGPLPVPGVRIPSLY